MTKEQILALPAGPELDALVAERVMGWHRNRSGYYTTVETDRLTYPGEWISGVESRLGTRWRWEADGDYYACTNDCEEFHPSADIAAAWEVFQWLTQRDRDLMLRRTATGAWLRRPQAEWVIERDMGYSPTESLCDAETAPLAICRAALLATAERLSE